MSSSPLTPDRDRLRKIDGPRLLWHSDYHDGPVSGMLELDGEQCWFLFVDSLGDDDERTRIFNVYRLTQEQLADEIERMAYFRERVGTHCDYKPDGKRDIGGLRPQEMRAAFYERYPPGKDRGYSKNEVIAWFEW